MRGECMDVFVSKTIEDIEKREWTALTGKDAIEHSYEWLKAVESAGLRDMQYIFIRDNGSLTAAACSILLKERVGLFNLPVLEVRSPFTASQGFFSEDPTSTHLLIERLEHIRDETNALGYVIMDLPSDEYIALKDQMKGLSRFPMLENTYIDLHFSDFDDYLGSLEEYAWRSARMTLNRAKRWKIKTIFTTELRKWAGEAHRLQRYTCSEHNDFQWLLPEKFYGSLEEYLGKQVELQLFFKGDIILASAVVLNTPTVCYYRFPGIDPRYKKYHAYFLMYYEGIRKALERNQKKIYFGLTGYSFKERIGCKKEDLYGFAKMKHLVFELGLKMYLSILRRKK
jgi:predicted N-acyltransferase